MMKKLLLLFLLTSCIAFSQNTVTDGNWYKINSKGSFVTKIKASGEYAEHEIVVHLINQHWATSEVEYISEYNYNHLRIKLEWGYLGSGSNQFLTVRIVPITAAYANGFTFQDVSNPSFDYGLEVVSASLVTPITPKSLLFVDEWTGNVGIGKINPTFKLDVNGDINTLTALYFANHNHGIIRGGSNIYGNDVTVYTGDGGLNFATSGPPYGKPSLDMVKMRIINNGNVGIGTITPDEKLSVNGNIHTKEVRVDLIGWSDFVFESNYNLPTLKDVEQHIKEKGHLKDIPSATEVAKNGILLGEMNAKLLQKIEELILYTIEQEKQLEEQEKQLESQQTQLNVQVEINQELAKRLLKLEQLVLKTR